MEKVMTLDEHQERYVQNALYEIEQGGNCKHDVWVYDSISGYGIANLKTIEPPVIGLCNDDDSHYWQAFKNWDEINAFISELKRNATTAWGEDKQMENKRVWYQKGYEQGKKDAQPSILDDKYKDEMFK